MEIEFKDFSPNTEVIINGIDVGMIAYNCPCTHLPHQRYEFYKYLRRESHEDTSKFIDALPRRIYGRTRDNVIDKLKRLITADDEIGSTSQEEKKI